MAIRNSEQESKNLDNKPLGAAVVTESREPQPNNGLNVKFHQIGGR